MERRLYRSRSDRLLWGVCGGLGAYFDIDPVIIRVLFVVATFSGGIGIIAYIILAIVVPLEGSTASTPREARQENIAEMKQTAHDFSEDLRSGLAKNQVEHTDRDPERAIRIHRHRNLIGLIVVIIGVLALLSSLNIFWWFRWAYFWPVILIVIGLIIILSPRRRR